MRKLASSICAAAVAFSMAGAGVIPSTAAPLYSTAPTAPEAQIVDVKSSKHFKRYHKRGWGRNWRDARHARRDYGRMHRRGGHYYYNGHRGYSYYRPGYRRHGDFWFPAAAFIAGAIITGAINQSSRGHGNAHVDWCYDRYRSYRAWDNTFQPYEGPRRQCYSPYS